MDAAPERAWLSPRLNRTRHYEFNLSNWPCCLWVDLPALAPGGACWRRTGRRVPIGALPLQGTITVLTVTPARRRPSPLRSFKEPDDHRQHAPAQGRASDRADRCGSRYAQG